MYPGCEAVTCREVTRLDKPDAEGCNWPRTLFLDSAGASPEDYVPAYAAIVEEGRKAFNLKPEELSDTPAPWRNAAIG
ncbi:MAG: hypothetical protein ACT4P3_12175 [Betaproteobacteria bacterium]